MSNQIVDAGEDIFLICKFDQVGSDGSTHCAIFVEVCPEITFTMAYWQAGRHNVSIARVTLLYRKWLVPWAEINNARLLLATADFQRIAL